ncbi:MAG: T9SS type A sorting domain-containing protein [Sphingobacteriales bacterium]|nr:MAG: T9SS type A sorting domain-containing protein [Sphingobacteriales bacterium]
MKKMLLLLALTATVAVSAQLQNMDFETWVNPIGSLGYNSPTGWTRSNGVPLSENMGFYHDPVTDAQNGTYALRLSIWYTYDKDFAYQVAPIASRPSALTGHYTYTNNQIMDALSGDIRDDEASVKVYLTKWNAVLAQNDTIGRGELTLHNALEYTVFNCPIIYSSDEVPDTIKVILDSTLMDKTPEHPMPHTSAIPGGVCSLFTVDNLALVTNVLDIEDHVAAVAVRAYPNPVNNVLNIANFEGRAELYDAAGKQVLSKDAAVSGLDVSGLAQGIYLLKLTEGETVLHKKIIKQ